jgi:hypothetical protein
MIIDLVLFSLWFRMGYWGMSFKNSLESWEWIFFLWKMRQFSLGR